MKVMIVGNGGREHAIGLALAESTEKPSIISCPGNAGLEMLGDVLPVDLTKPQKILDICREKLIDLVVIGPEAPLATGVADLLRRKGFLVFGPGASGSKLEASKSFARFFMQKYGIPHPVHEVYTEFEQVMNNLESRSSYPVVVKADGLAAGKGVIIANTFGEAAAAVTDMMKNRRFGDAGKKILIEDFLDGWELSVHVVTDGKEYVRLPYSIDHKRIGEGDTGPNTGGMGAVSSNNLVDDKLERKITETIINPTIDGLMSESIPYRGVIYFGLIIVNEDPFVLEYNCRFGDPETQAILPLLKDDLLELLLEAATGELSSEHCMISSDTSSCVVMAAKGYPGAPETGMKITFPQPEEVPSDVRIVHAGTTIDEKKDIIVSGGRVLSVTGMGGDFSESIEKVYQTIKKIKFKGAYWRKDIGWRIKERI